MAGKENRELKADEKVEQARELVMLAAQLLKSLDAERARIGWMLEDTITYLDEVDLEDEIAAAHRMPQTDLFTPINVPARR